MQDTGDETGGHACQKGKNKCCPRTHTSADQHDGNRTSGCKRTVHGQIRKIQDAEGKVNANRHNGPNQALRQCARHGIEQCCNVQEIVNSSKKI